jgi:glycosyltransferase involved in cell wall biosynthesis
LSDVLIILTPGFPESEQDTTCLPAFQQFALSVKKCFPQLEPIILTFQYPYTKREYVWHGIKVISLGGKNKPRAWRLLTWINAYLVLKTIKKKRKVIGLLSLWLTECALVGDYFAKLNKLNHYMWLIGQDAKTTNQYIKRIKPKGRKIIAMSDFLKEAFFKNHGQLPFMVAENGINESIFPPLNLDNRTIDILGIGSLIPLKNYKLFIEIIYEIKKTFPQIKAAIAGSGEEESTLKSLVSIYRLEKNIEFLGMLPHLKVFEVMNNSKLFLHTSDYEGNSTVLMEALYSGCYTFSRCSLSSKKVEHLFIRESKLEFVADMEELLSKKEINYTRIKFNTMDNTAKKIIDLFISQ